MNFLRHFLLAALAFTVLDLIWLGILARRIYERYLGHHMRPQTDWLAAILFYFIFLAGLVYFVVLPAAGLPARKVLLNGAFFGAVAYSTYELTNRAVLKDWPWEIVLIDIAWGALLCSIVAWVSWHFGGQR